MVTATKEYCYETLERNMVRIYEQAERLASLDIPVLVQGRSGTGKKAVCEILHRKGKRRFAPLVSVNCAAIPENLIEAELFGFYQGPVLVKGKLETARDGILAIHKIDELPLSTQEKILRAIKDKKLYRLDDQRPIDFQARVIGTARHDLADLVKQNKFLAELNYFFECVVIKMPLLTERVKDVPVLVEYFLNELIRNNQRGLRLSPEVYHFLCRRDWQGNIRELKNYITRLYYLADKEVLTVQDALENGLESEVLQRHRANDIAPLTSFMPLSLEEMEKEYILRTMEATQGNKSRAARALKISLKTLRSKLKEYGTSQPLAVLS